MESRPEIIQIFPEKITKFHKHKQSTINFISKFTSLPNISTSVSQTRHQAKSFSNLLTSDFLKSFLETTQIFHEI